MAKSPSQFAAACLGLTEYPAPSGKLATDSRCWLCDGPTGGRGWLLREAAPDTMVAANRAACQTSDAVCWQCAATVSKQVWESVIAKYPDRGLKTGYAVSFRNYSHVFTPQVYDCPTRERWRGWLLNPPNPPFLFIMAVSSQKHLIFRGTVSHDRDWFPVQMEEESFMVKRILFGECLADFEALYALGFSKDSILTGHYHAGQMMKIGLSVWKPLADTMDGWRLSHPSLMKLCHFCAQKPEETP
jgi:CRISPR type IV-associated protein Csf1